MQALHLPCLLNTVHALSLLYLYTVPCSSPVQKLWVVEGGHAGVSAPHPSSRGWSLLRDWPQYVPNASLWLAVSVGFPSTTALLSAVVQQSLCFLPHPPLIGAVKPSHVLSGNTMQVTKSQFSIVQGWPAVMEVVKKQYSRSAILKPQPYIRIPDNEFPTMAGNKMSFHCGTPATFWQCCFHHGGVSS